MKEFKFTKENNKLIKNYCSGVYAIRNDLNNNMYIGSSSNIRSRYKYHLYSFLSGNGVSQKLQQDIDTIGIDKFSFIILEECDNNISTIKFIESKYIEQYGYYNNNSVDGKPVYCYSLDGTYVRQYDNLRQASIELNGFNDNIRACCDGRKKSYKGFMWSFDKANRLGPWSRKKINSSPVLQYTLDGKLLKVYNSTKEASYVTGINKSTIESAASTSKPTHKSAKGFIWKYKKDTEVIDEQ